MAGEQYVSNQSGLAAAKAWLSADYTSAVRENKDAIAAKDDEWNDLMVTLTAEQNRLNAEAKQAEEDSEWGKTWEWVQAGLAIVAAIVFAPVTGGMSMVAVAASLASTAAGAYMALEGIETTEEKLSRRKLLTEVDTSGLENLEGQIDQFAWDLVDADTRYASLYNPSWEVNKEGMQDKVSGDLEGWDDDWDDVINKYGTTGEIWGDFVKQEVLALTTMAAPQLTAPKDSTSAYTAWRAA